MSGYFGPEIWSTPLANYFPSYKAEIGNVTLKELWVPIILFTFFVAHLPACIVNVAKARRSRNQPLLPLLKEWTPLVIFVTCTIAWLGSPYSSLLKDNHLVLYCLTMSLVFGRMTTKIILAHLTHQPFPYWTIMLAPMIGGALIINHPYFTIPGTSFFGPVSAGFELWYLRAYFVFAAVVYGKWAHLVITTTTISTIPPYKNVLLIGAGGSLAAPVLAAFAARSEYNLTILTRHDSSATFPSGVPVVKANYISLNSLISAFKGQDAIVSLIGGHALSSQDFFIDAAIRAGVKRFIPSEYGPNSRNEDFVKYNDVVLPVRAGIVDYLKYKEGQGDGKLSWTSVICGGFFDWMLYSGMLGFDLKSRSVELIDNGTSVCTFTSFSTVGETVVKILDRADETRNQYVFTMSFQVSPRDVLEVIEKVDGKKWSVHYTTCEEVITKGRKRLDNGDFAGIMDLTRGAAFGRLALGDESKNGFWNQRLELVEDEDIEEAVRDVLRGQGMLSE
ncbi:unnamed protein product [Alternaria alternata]